ncbi:DsbA family protein [Nocardioides panaciterrulae]|uniref:Protein-disulfide isomerase n=1 Tax=Nocardioides panaciterrulae TaxID=661492 RepID=A0A7Y9JB75_9ACTN|nr:thioredoxin domain-containing protein [Nocardioides panaciterrulae]NYD42655.1 protein-disulfide isomerase [Nocardioides panaciterrulae]
MSKQTPESRSDRAAAALRDQQRAERRRATRMIAIVVAVIIVLVGGGFLLTRSLDTSTNVSAPPAGAGTWGVTVGDKNAPHSVVVYEDFLCPYCGEFERATHDKLATLADQGKVYVEYRPFNLLQTDYSVAAASAFKVVLADSGPAVAKKFHDLLYADQPQEQGPYPSSSWLVDKAVAAGASESAVRSDIEQESQKAWVDRATQAAADAGVRSTPTILLDGKVFVDGTTIDQLAQNLLARVG